MVIPLGPGKFYGSSLPRPRIYTDVKLNTDRVDPPVPVMDPFLSWAHEAHWSMGGLNFTRLRYQGRIEGNAEKLRKLREKQAKSQAKTSPKNQPKESAPNGKQGSNKKRGGSVSPPPAPKVAKKRRFLQLLDEESEEEEDQEVEEMEAGLKKGPARKLVGDFERVAQASDKNMRDGDLAMKVVDEVISEGKKLRRGKKGKKSSEEIGSGLVKGQKSSEEIESGLVNGGVRSSPRLAKRRSG